MWTVVIVLLILVWIYGACTWVQNRKKSDSCSGDCAHCHLNPDRQNCEEKE